MISMANQDSGENALMNSLPNIRLGRSKHYNRYKGSVLNKSCISSLDVHWHFFTRDLFSYLMSIYGVVYQCPHNPRKIERKANWPITGPLNCRPSQECSPVKSKTYRKRKKTHGLVLNTSIPLSRHTLDLCMGNTEETQQGKSLSWLRREIRFGFSCQWVQLHLQQY